MRQFGDIILAGLGSLRNARLENRADDPSSPIVGQIWFNTTEGTYKGYDGTAVFSFSTGGSATLIQSELDRLETALGVESDGSLATITGTNYVNGAASMLAAIKAVDSALKTVDTKEAAIITAVGLGSNGSYSAPTGTNYLGSATSVANADSLLDSQIKTVADAASSAQDEIDAIELAVGLNSDGSFAQFSETNYLDGATGVTNGMGLLDTQVKTNADNIAQNTTDIGTKVAKAGDTMSGNLSFDGSHTITNLPAPVDSNDAVNKLYVDSRIAGLSWKNPVRVATTANLNALSGLLTIDGVTLVAGNRVLVKNQTAAADNGIYVAAEGAWARADDFDQTTPINEVNGAAVVVIEGATFGNWGFTQNLDVETIGTDPMSFVQFNGAAFLTAGIGLSQVGNELRVNLGSGIFEGPTDEVGLDLYQVANSAIILTTDGSARSTAANAQLALLLNGSTLNQGSGGLKVASAGITEVELNASVAGDGLVGGGGNPLSVSVDNSSLEISEDSLRVKADGIVTALIADDQVTNAKLANKGVTFGADSGSADLITLGETVTIAGDTGISTAVDAGTNTISVALNATLDMLNDVTITSPVAGQELVFNGDTFVNKATSYLYDGTVTATDTHVITHSLGNKYPNVTIYDSTDKVIGCDYITADSANQLTITFSSPITCRVRVSV